MIIKLLKLAGGAVMGADKASIKAIDKLAGGVYEFQMLTDIPKKPRRSSQQNSYYWGVVLTELVRAVDDSYTTEQFHDMLKGIYFGHIPVGNSYIIGGSTTTLSTSEMEEYLAGCRNWAYENLQLTILLPNEAGFDY
jgi:hypothetical protein